MILFEKDKSTVPQANRRGQFRSALTMTASICFVIFSGLTIEKAVDVISPEVAPSYSPFADALTDLQLNQVKLAGDLVALAASGLAAAATAGLLGDRTPAGELTDEM